MTDLLTNPNLGNKVFKSILVLAWSLECVYNDTCPVNFSTICIISICSPGTYKGILFECACIYIYSDLLLEFRYCIVMPLLNLYYLVHQSC